MTMNKKTTLIRSHSTDGAYTFMLGGISVQFTVVERVQVVA
jgi:hypothetical protein